MSGACRRCAALLLALALVACGRHGRDGAAAPDIVPGGGGALLERAAIDAGLVPSPDGRTLSGRYERTSELGTDRFCAVGGQGNDHAIGLVAVFGADSQCEAQGHATQDGGVLHIRLDGAGACAFDAVFDGDMIRFPGRVPDGCVSYCSPRASLAGVSFLFVEAGDAAARRSTGRRFARLCG